MYPYVHVARANLPFEETSIGALTKIDAFTQINHGVHIGERVLIASGTQIGGGCEIENDVWIGINATISNRIHIGSNAKVSLGVVVTKSVKSGERVSGNFVIPHKALIRHIKGCVDND